MKEQQIPIPDVVTINTKGLVLSLVNAERDVSMSSFKGARPSDTVGVSVLKNIAAGNDNESTFP